jgi:malate dehydrogenase
MALDDNVGELSVYDLTIAMVPPGGVAADLGHLEKKVKVTGYAKALDEKAIDKLGECLTGCDLVLVPAGMPRKPGQTRDDLFKINAGIAKEVVEACAKYCPNAVVALIVNPVNSVVPAMAELYKKKGLDPKKIVGVTTLDCVRANKFVGEIAGVDPDDIDVPVIGGHAGVTIMPVFSQDKHSATIPEAQIPPLMSMCRMQAPMLSTPRTVREVPLSPWHMQARALVKPCLQVSMAHQPLNVPTFCLMWSKMCLISQAK